MIAAKAPVSTRDASSVLLPLRQFFTDHGHAHVPNIQEYASLFDLCQRLRTMKERLPGKVSSELDGMGFLWQLTLPNDLRWYYNFGELKAFCQEHGHTRVPLRKSPYNALGSWVLRQRRDEKKISKQHRKLLASIGFEWSSDIKSKKENEWRLMFDKLNKFHKAYGHSNVPDRYSPDGKLGRWVSTVRYAAGSLDPWKKKLLRSVDFKTSEDIRHDKDASRRLLFKKIEKHFEHYGHANVPESYKDSKLAIAVAYLRQYPDRISPVEKKQLKKWNFLFSDEIKQQWEQLWESSFKKLMKFKQRFGHCRVSSAFEDQPLARWVANQRKDEQEGRLPEARRKRLERIGFSFYKDIAAIQEANWLSMYGKLVKFKAKFGTTIVKEGFRDSKLAYWVQHQRQARRKMTATRKRLLNDIQFTWSVRQ